MKKVIAEITTFKGLSIGAEHYYLSMNYYDSNNNYIREEISHPLTSKEVLFLNKKERRVGSTFRYRVGRPSKGFLSEEETKIMAINWFKENTSDYDILLLGYWGIASVQECLYAKKEYVKQIINKLYYIAEKINWYEKDPELMDALDDIFKEIINQ